MLKTLLAGTVVLGLAAAPAVAGQQPTPREKADKTTTAKAGAGDQTFNSVSSPRTRPRATR